jgi:hypothetical protein
MTPPLHPHPSTADWVAWLQAELKIAGWTVHTLHGDGAPELFAAHQGDILLIWVRPAGRPEMTQIARTWAREVFEEPPTSERPRAYSGTNVFGLLSVPSPEGRDIARDMAGGDYT